jgi:hypothetical protein
MQRSDNWSIFLNLALASGIIAALYFLGKRNRRSPRKREQELDHSLEETFPASDSVAKY